MMIRIATIDDTLEIENIYNEILDYEAQTVSYTNWQKGLYPTVDYAKGAIEKNSMFVGEDEKGIYGSVVLNSIQPKEYGNIQWITKAESSEVMVIHTLCIRPSESGKGKARIMMNFIEKYAKEQKYKVIRLDTYEGNIPAATLYPKIGYLYVGTTKFHFQNVIWENLKCFEKALF
ncbi:GNAT family N-acetyltransferase [Clostridium saccharoperbutylacetonicum]|uniref:GNAT family N-acetyltransferase n=1 Tax=Clostridium saccharoperbutylacetonicum TaxID=36745 RepID=UPI001D22C989|nr:GNAT family N-acetyltransferase [Clostridium saccharoperbutylacetonicum]NSB32274.1 ribosomal protein S18 acetylase RimI-like enzyme [Clostridium saccharoperbutylacetonicum]